MIFSIKNATPSDAEFIAKNILAGMGYDVFSKNADEAFIEIGQGQVSIPEAIKSFGQICSLPNTLYSYSRTRIAYVDGIPAGSLTAYPSDDYPSLRDYTWPLLGADDTSTEAECRPGEFYLDSLAVRPEYRGISYEYEGTTDRTGHLLMLDGIHIAQEKGLRHLSLIVDKSKPRLAVYYSALGFRPEGDILFFGHLYTRMVKDL